MAVTILYISPELYSTKIAVSEDEKKVYQCEINHSGEDFLLFENNIEQLPFRRDAIVDRLRKDGINLKSIKFVASEGGLLKPCQSGVYQIDKNMIGDLIDGIGGNDIINLGGMIAFTIANSLNVKSFLVEPSSVDERSDLAAFTPNISLKKKSLFHTLHHKYLARKYAKSVNKKYEDIKVILCHVSDRSVSVAAHDKGKVIDVNQSFMGYGPMGLCEIGTLPASDIVDMIYTKCYHKDEMLKLINTKGTFISYLGTNSYNDIAELSKNNDKKTKLILEAMAYQISKEIASHYASLEGEIDAVILSGKIFTINRFFKYISKRIANIAPIKVYDDDFTFEAMIDNVLQIVNKEMDLKYYD
jgi:butyrate kinase